MFTVTLRSWISAVSPAGIVIVETSGVAGTAGEVGVAGEPGESAPLIGSTWVDAKVVGVPIAPSGVMATDQSTSVPGS